MPGKLEGKTAIIVGASAGMGLSSARLFVEEGANVVIVGRNQERLQAAADEIGEKCLPFQADVRDEARLGAAFDAAMEKWGALHVVFNNAGPGLTGPKLLHELTLDEFNEAIAVNLTAVWLGMRFGIPLIEASGGGSIISTSSIGALQGIPTTGPYSAAKYGAHSLTRTCAAEVASKNIRVNCIIPGAITTRFALPSDAEQTEEDLQARRERGARISPMARSGDPEEIATLALFLACDDSSFITGQCIAADGGMTSVNGWIQDRG